MNMTMKQFPKLWTDYPIEELGDISGQRAPIRECVVAEAPSIHSKYVIVEIDGIKTELKRGYIYSRPGRCGEVPTYDFMDGWGLSNYRWVAPPPYDETSEQIRVNDIVTCESLGGAEGKRARVVQTHVWDNGKRSLKLRVIPPGILPALEFWEDESSCMLVYRRPEKA